MELVRLLRYVVLLRFVAVVGGVVGVVGDCGMSWAAIKKNTPLGLVSGEMLNEAATRQGFTYFHLSKVSCFSTAFQKTTGVRRSQPLSGQTKIIAKSPKSCYSGHLKAGPSSNRGFENTNAASRRAPLGCYDHLVTGLNRNIHRN